MDELLLIVVVYYLPFLLLVTDLFFFIWWLLKEPFVLVGVLVILVDGAFGRLQSSLLFLFGLSVRFSGCPGYLGRWGVRSSGIITSLLLFRLSVQMKELIVVYIKIEPFVVLTIRIVDNDVYLPGSFFCFLWRFGPILC